MDIDNYAPARRPGPGVKNIIWAALALGIVSIILMFFSYAGAAVFGAIGLFAGGFAMARAMKRVQAGEIGKNFVYIAGAGLILSVIGFMVGYAGLVG